MFNTIRKKLITGFSLVLIVIIAFTVHDLFIYNGSMEHIVKVRESSVKSFKYASEMKNNVIRVWQFLTDVSATKDTARLIEAEEQYNLYKKNSEEFAALNPEYRAQLEELNAEFDKLYSYGKEMADEYVKKGHEAGNIMMAEFDSMIDSFCAKVDEIQKKSEAAMNDSLMAIQKRMKINQGTSVVLSIITIILALLISVFLARGIVRPVNNLMEIFKDLETGQGDLTRRININSKDELARLARSFNNFMNNLESMVANIKKNSARVSQGSENLSKGSLQASASISEINTHMEKLE